MKFNEFTDTKTAKAIERALRKEFRSGIVYQDVLDAALSTEKGPRGGKKFTCNECGRAHSRKDIQIDHREPVVPLSGSLMGLTCAELVSRVFCAEENLQVLCVPCHKIKSSEENKLRRKSKVSG